MLKNIDPILNADILYALAAMGHGDEIALVDANFPADSVAKSTTLGELLRMENISAARATKAILSLMPLDSYIDQPASRMEVVGNPDKILPVQSEVQTEIDSAQGKSLPLGAIERFAFYERAKNAYCVIQTGERRFYGCFILTKGVIAPNE